MKSLKYLSLFSIVVLTLTSCRGDEDKLYAEKERVDLLSVGIPESPLTVGTAALIEATFNLSSACEAPYGLEMTSSGIMREITAYKYSIPSETCGETIEQTSQVSFAPKTPGTYTLRFHTTSSDYVDFSIVVVEAPAE